MINNQENKHNEHEDIIGYSVGQPQDRDSLQSQMIVKKYTLSKPEAPTNVILGDSIVKIYETSQTCCCQTLFWDKKMQVLMIYLVIKSQKI